MDSLRSSFLRSLRRPPSSTHSPLSVPPGTAPPSDLPNRLRCSLRCASRPSHECGERPPARSPAARHPVGSMTRSPATRPRHPAPAGAWVSRGRAGAVRSGWVGLKGASRSANPDEVSTAAERGAQRVPGAERLGAFWLFAVEGIPVISGAFWLFTVEGIPVISGAFWLFVVEPTPAVGGAFWLFAVRETLTTDGPITSLPSNRTRTSRTTHRQNVHTGGGPRAGR